MAKIQAAAAPASDSPSKEAGADFFDSISKDPLPEKQGTTVPADGVTRGATLSGGTLLPEVPPKPPTELSDVRDPVPGPATVQNSDGVFVTTAGSGRYRVTCEPPTPIAHTCIEVDADGEDNSFAEFLKVNGITWTNAPRVVERIGDKTGAPISFPEPVQA